jgi:phosphate transport system permease protein
MAATSLTKIESRGTREEPTIAVSLRRRTRWSEAIAEGVIKATALVSILSVALIIAFITKEALPLLLSADVHREVTPLDLLVPRSSGGFVWQPVSAVPKYNVLPLFAGTLKVSFIALAVAIPLSVLAALYVSDFATRRLRETLKPIIELLAGVPSVVVGFFALVVLSTWVQRVFGTEHRLNAVVAGLGLSFAVCPIVFSISEDALRAVPASYRAAAQALGATRSQALLRVVIPAAMPGIAGAVVLGFGRAVGETMIVLLASGNAALLDVRWGHSTRTVTATIAQELGEVVTGGPHYRVLYALGALLFLATLVINILGEAVIQRMRGTVRATR